MSHVWKGSGKYGTVGIEFVLSIGFGFFLGDWLDGKSLGWLGFDTTPWLTLFWTLAGLAAGFRALYRAAKTAERDAERLDREEREARRQYHERKR